MVHLGQVGPPRGPGIQADRPTPEYGLQFPGNDLPDGQPGMVRLAPTAGLANNEDSQGAGRGTVPVSTDENRLGSFGTTPSIDRPG